MEFDGTFGLDDVTTEEVWLALSDPVMIENALPGCQFLVEVDDPDDVDFEALEEAAADEENPPTLPEADPEDVAERGLVEGGHYAALVQVGVGSVKPRFETVVTIDRREFPEMDASGQGSASDSSFEMDSGMTLVETENGVDVEWWTEADVFGRVAQMGQRVINPVANRVVGRFFKQVQKELSDVGDESSGLRDRISNYI
ncbi:carbon monoxide dehydrogenase [Haloplanus rallus]|jgi:carbon monoxide dehydrogenase subunit G|uniref:Carbon monoxide dehydrogenase n=1 Tax=Haloplanus rallus TaxID=1816183 RepID=A0A6B9F7N3_9EURY|nr:MULTISPECIES: SRPBCC domain-containing protein [Haloplanus]QGX94311.1 carbon monoxide dehydrogenase [Haloplanus rallus]